MLLVNSEAHDLAFDLAFDPASNITDHELVVVYSDHLELAVNREYTKALRAIQTLLLEDGKDLSV